MSETNFLKMIKRAVELCRPDLRSYYRVTRKAKVVTAYASDGQYFADVQPLRNDESPDPKEPVIPHVEIPILWGGPNRGVVCPPQEGTLCDLSYYDGDPNYPRISNFRWQGNGAPNCGLTELIIQQEPGTSIHIDKSHSIITLSPANWEVRVGGDASITAAGTLTLDAPQIIKKGNETCTGSDGGTGRTTEDAHRTTNGSFTLNGPLVVNGSLTVNGDSSVSGNSAAGSRSGGPCPH